jgi:hypothetical protein
MSKFQDTYIEYHFTDDHISPCVNLEIPIKKIQDIFSILREKFGENEIIKEYSVYRHNDMELTLFPDGSCFCRQISIKELKDEKVPLYITYVKKHKIANDVFPCKYMYHSAKDIVDVIFHVNEDIQIILRTNYENNIQEKIKELQDLGRPRKIQSSSQTWCELSIVANCSASIDDIYKSIHLLQELPHVKHS